MSEATCKECDTESYSKKYFRFHGMIAHSGTAVCPVCSKVTKHEISLREHMNMHANKTNK